MSENLSNPENIASFDIVPLIQDVKLANASDFFKKISTDT